MENAKHLTDFSVLLLLLYHKVLKNKVPVQ